jgi:hypothetical protein
MDRSNKILNDREIEGKNKCKSQKVEVGRKRRLDDGEEGSDAELEEDGEGTGRMVGSGRVGITLRLKSRTTG